MNWIALEKQLFVTPSVSLAGVSSRDGCGAMQALKHCLNNLAQRASSFWFS